MQRARSVFERALDTDHRSITLWLQYAEMEMRQNFFIFVVCRLSLFKLYLSAAFFLETNKLIMHVMFGIEQSQFYLELRNSG